jgi:hypothetical protein
VPTHGADKNPVKRFKMKPGTPEPISNIFRQIESTFRTLLYNISPLLLAEYRYLMQMGKTFNPKNPQTFDQKLIWLMLYWKHPLKTRCADKYAVRSYVEEHGMGHVLPELLGVYERSSEIDFERLPGQFVLKCTHGWGFNLFCINRNNFDIECAKRKLDTWMKINPYKITGEVHYAPIRPRIICEAYLGDLAGNAPDDYKIYCFDGKAHCTMACTERVTGAPKFDFFDLDWREKLPYCKSSLLANRKILRPKAYSEMRAAAEILSKPFPFVRMDFYSINGKAILGEMTFTPNGSIDVDYTDMAQNVMGKLLYLPEKYRAGGL